MPAHLSNGYFEIAGLISILDRDAPLHPLRAPRARDRLDAARGPRTSPCSSGSSWSRRSPTIARRCVRWAQAPGEHAIALDFKIDFTAPREVDWLGKAYEIVTSPVTGERFTRYFPQPVTYRLPFYSELVPDGRRRCRAGI